MHVCVRVYVTEVGCSWGGTRLYSPSYFNLRNLEFCEDFKNIGPGHGCIPVRLFTMPGGHDYYT